MGHYLTLCTQIYIYNAQFVALETKKCRKKITQDSDVNQWPQGLVFKNKSVSMTY